MLKWILSRLKSILKTEKLKKSVKTEQESEGEEDVKKNIKSVYFAKQENLLKQHYQ